MSIFNSQNQEDKYAAENLLDSLVNSLNSMRDGSSNPEKISHKVKQVKNQIKYIRDNHPESEYCNLEHVLFGGEVAEQFKELKEFL